MPVQVVHEGKTVETAKADPADIKAIEMGAVNLLQEALDNKLSFFLGVFKVEDGEPGIVLTGHGSPSDMILMAESLADKAERTRPPVEDFLDLLQIVFGADAVRVINEPRDLDAKVPASEGPMTDPFADQNS